MPFWSSRIATKAVAHTHYLFRYKLPTFSMLPCSNVAVDMNLYWMHFSTPWHTGHRLKVLTKDMVG